VLSGWQIGSGAPTLEAGRLDLSKMASGQVGDRMNDERHLLADVPSAMAPKERTKDACGRVCRQKNNQPQPRKRS
jgi:hypothetical protein